MNLDTATVGDIADPGPAEDGALLAPCAFEDPPMRVGNYIHRADTNSTWYYWPIGGNGESGSSIDVSERSGAFEHYAGRLTQQRRSAGTGVCGTPSDDDELNGYVLCYLRTAGGDPIELSTFDDEHTVEEVVTFANLFAESHGVGQN